MGAPCEGLTYQEIKERYGILNGFVTEELSGTDDTDFMIFNSLILLEHGVGVTVEQVDAEWRDKLLGEGRYYRPGGFSDVISSRNLVKGLRAPQSGSFNHQMWSDGVAMAIGSAGISAPGNPALAAKLAETLGSISNGRDGIYSAQAVAAAIGAAVMGGSPDEMLSAALEACPSDSWTHTVIERAWRIGSSNLDFEAKIQQIAEELVLDYWPWADLTTEAVSISFAVFLATGGEFVKAVPAGIRMGRDADTIGAIVGSLAGAYQGLSAIPEEWQSRVQASKGYCIGYVAGKSILDIADGLARQAWEGLQA
jgi:ADP-ribosylglycohydrolase